MPPVPSAPNTSPIFLDQEEDEISERNAATSIIVETHQEYQTALGNIEQIMHQVNAANLFREIAPFFTQVTTNLSAPSTLHLFASTFTEESINTIILAQNNTIIALLNDIEVYGSVVEQIRMLTYNQDLWNHSISEVIPHLSSIFSQAIPTPITGETENMYAYRTNPNQYTLTPLAVELATETNPEIITYNTNILDFFNQHFGLDTENLYAQSAAISSQIHNA